MPESDLLAHIFQRSKGLTAPNATILVGPGDDCAVLVPRGHGPHAPQAPANQLLLKVDQLVESRHFIPSTPIDLIARKAIARAISDIAAMGGSPIASLCAATLPANYPHANALFDHCAKWANHFAAPLIGGDICILSQSQPGPLSLSITLLGRPHASRGPVLRSTAQPGDSVYITGNLGNSFASGRHLSFEPRLAEAAFLCDTLGPQLHSMMDISDGLGIDASRLAHASHCRLELEPLTLPRHQDCPDWLAAARDGEDYELLFTASGPVPSHIPATTTPPTPITRIGRVTTGTDAIFQLNNSQLNAATMGWNHGA